MSYRYKTVRGGLGGLQESGVYGLEEGGFLQRPRFSNLRILRRSKRLTLEKLSSLTGISPSYLSRLEQGARRLNADLMDKIAGVLGCEPADLLGVSPTPLAFSGGRSSGASAERASVFSEENSRSLIPVYRLATAVSALGQDQQPERVDFDVAFDQVSCPAELRNVPKAFAVCVADSGYAPRYDMGDMVFVHPLRPLSMGCVVFVVCKDGRSLLRTFGGWSESGLLTGPVHKIAEAAKAEEAVVPKSEVSSVGRVVGVRNA